MSKQLSYKDNFDMLLFRHDYLRRVESYDPNWLVEFKTTIHVTANKMYKKHIVNMNRVGLGIDDAIQLSNMFTIYYMSLYSIYKTEESYTKYEARFVKWHGRKPNKQEQLNSNRNQLINFITQRFNRVNILCIQKSRNIMCDNEISMAFAQTDDSKPVCDAELLLDHKSFGYRKITINELKKASKAMKSGDCGVLTDENGFKIRQVRVQSTHMNPDDYKSIMSHSRGCLNNDPEQVVEYRNEDIEMATYKEDFAAMKTEQRIKTLNKFIEKNKKNKRLKEEIKTARKLIKSIEKSVVL